MGIWAESVYERAEVSRWIRQVPLDPFILRLFYGITRRCKKGLRIPRLNHYLAEGTFDGRRDMPSSDRCMGGNTLDQEVVVW